MEQLRISVEDGLKKYVELVRSYGLPADYRMDSGTDVVETATHMCEALVKEFPKSMVFSGKLIFRQERFLQSYFIMKQLTLFNGAYSGMVSRRSSCLFGSDKCARIDFSLTF